MIPPVAYDSNYHRSPSPGGKIVALCFSDNPIDIVLAPSDIEVHPSELVLHLLFLLPQFRELMQSARSSLFAFPSSSSYQHSWLFQIHYSHSSKNASSFELSASDIRRRRSLSLRRAPTIFFKPLHQRNIFFLNLFRKERLCSNSL